VNRSRAARRLAGFPAETLAPTGDPRLGRGGADGQQKWGVGRVVGKLET